MDKEMIAQLANDVNNVVATAIRPYQIQLKNIETKWKQLVEQKIRLERALDYAKSFIDGYSAARIKEGLGREGMDAVLNEIDNILESTNICPICGDEKPVSDLHRNCGK